MLFRLFLTIAAAFSFPASLAQAADQNRCPPDRDVCAFVRDADGRFRTVVLPFDPYVNIAINDRSELAGMNDPVPSYPRGWRGFLRDRRGRIEFLPQFPGKIGTVVLDLNDRGQVVGHYCDNRELLCPSGRRGFLFSRKDGRFVRIHPPGAVDTEVFGVNDRGQAVGQVLDRGGRYRGFRWDGGRFTFLDVRGAAATAAIDINNRGEIVGIWARPGRTELRGFLLSGGVYRKFAAPGLPFTSPNSINDRGEIVGYVASALPLPEAEIVRGFRLTRDRLDRFQRIEFPRAPRTLAWGLNDAGDIAGIYENPDFAGGTNPVLVRQDGAGGGWRGARPPDLLLSLRRPAGSPGSH